MPQTKLHVELLMHTPQPELAVSLGAKLCYSGARIGELKRNIEEGDSARFVEKLRSMGHLSPIEHAAFTFGIEGVSRALLAQITRHRLASFSVQSQRYVVAKDAFNYIVPPSIAALGDEAAAEFERQMSVMHGWYNEWLARTGAPEDARFVLPNACETRMVLTMNARELLHFFALRCCNRAQWEIRALAWAMLGLARNAAPSIFRLAGPGCVEGACPEGRMSCGRMEQIRMRSAELDDQITAGGDITDWAINSIR